MRVGIVGATGQVGSDAKHPQERSFPVDEMRLLPLRSAGTSIQWNGQEIVVEDASTADFSGVDIALFSAGRTTSLELAGASQGALVIDNSSAWRMDPEVPLVVPEVNADPC